MRAAFKSWNVKLIWILRLGFKIEDLEISKCLDSDASLKMNETHIQKSQNVELTKHASNS